MKKELFDDVCSQTSKLVTHRYSTSFSLGIKLFDKQVRPEIYALYGFVRFADEIVDSFHSYNQEELLNSFISSYHKALKDKISLNPIVHSFQKIIIKYNLHDDVDSFFESMRLDLTKIAYKNQENYEAYIYGSANVIGLMCLKIFVRGDQTQFDELKYYAEKLGSALQKINFLRDIKEDYNDLGRVYFPNIDFSNFSAEDKKAIEKEIKSEFLESLKGIKKLPDNCRLGVFVAYKYYTLLLKKIISKNEKELLTTRMRISNSKKIVQLCLSIIKYKISDV